MPSRRYYANAAPQQTLANSITNSATTLQVAGSFAGWPTQFPYFAVLDYGTASMEIVQVTGVVGTTATVVRGQDGTASISHPAGATLDQGVIRQDFDEANAHTTAQNGVHGVSGSVVGTTDSQTLSNKTLISPIVNTPTVNTPTINTPTISNGSASGLAIANAAGLGVGLANPGGNNASVGGQLSTSTLSVSGAATLGSLTLNGATVITDWFAITKPGFYVSAAGAANTPPGTSGTVQGFASVDSSGNLTVIASTQVSNGFPLSTGKITLSWSYTITSAGPASTGWQPLGHGFRAQYEQKTTAATMPNGSYATIYPLDTDVDTIGLTNTNGVLSFPSSTAYSGRYRVWGRVGLSYPGSITTQCGGQIILNSTPIATQVAVACVANAKVCIHLAPVEVAISAGSGGSDTLAIQGFVAAAGITTSLVAGYTTMIGIERIV